MEIDQIISEHIEPMTRRITDIIQHSKFQRKSKEEMCKIYYRLILDKYVEEQAKYFQRSMYGFAISSEKPGSFYLVYMHPHARVKSETVTVQPDGFLFRMRKFRDVDSLLRFFKDDEKKTLDKKIKESGGSHSQSRPRQRDVPRDPNRDSREGRSSNPGIHPSRAAMVNNPKY